MSRYAPGLLTALLFALLAALLIGPSPAQAHITDKAPDQTIQFADRRGEVIEGGVWLPPAVDDADALDASPHPLIVISHGNSGWYRGHSDTAAALAEAGFIVAALTHPGDNFRDQSRALQLTGRAPQFSALIDYMTRDWRGSRLIDPDRIGAFGFSAGGFTVTSIVGGESDLRMLLAHCDAHKSLFACHLLASNPPDPTTWRPQTRDDRVKAAVIAAPAFGLSFTAASLASVTVPIQLWQAAEDEILASPYHVEPIRDRLGRALEYHRVDDAGHFDFLPPCSPSAKAGTPLLCASPPGFDRAAFKAEFNRLVANFFRQALASSGA